MGGHQRSALLNCRALSVLQPGTTSISGSSANSLNQVLLAGAVAVRASGGGSGMWIMADAAVPKMKEREAKKSRQKDDKDDRALQCELEWAPLFFHRPKYIRLTGSDGGASDPVAGPGHPGPAGAGRGWRSAASGSSLKWAAPKASLFLKP